MSGKNLRVFCSNARGLLKNWSKATSFNWQEFDLVMFCEIWRIREFENLQVEGFEIKAIRQRDVTKGGGTVIFGRKELITTTLTTPYIEGTIETTGIKIGNTHFINIYRAPSGNKQDFVELLSDYLDTLGGEKILIGGDFNLNTLIENKWINQLCNNYQLETKIKSVTRIESGTCIDNFLTNLVGSFSVSSIAIADHQGIIANLKDINNETKKKSTKFEFRVMKEVNWLVFKQGMNSMFIKGENIEEKWSNLLIDIKTTVEESFPFKTSKHKYYFTMSQGLLKSRDKKNELLKKYKQGKIHKDVYINYNKCYRKLIKIEQTKTFKSKMDNAGSNGKTKWKVIKEGLLLNKTVENISEISVDGNLKTNEKNIAEAFKVHFETCASKLAENLPKGEDTSKILPQGNTWTFSHTSEIEIVSIIKTLLNKNSSGPDCLTNRMIKKEPYIFAKLLKPLINESISLGIFPTELKIANVIPIFKKGEKTNLNNYRPISLLPVISKIFEKVINSQLGIIIDDGYIDDNQFGFRRGHSTEDAVIRFVDKIEQDLALGKHVASVYIDVSKAFDSCDHSILLKKLERTGLNEVGIKLMGSYLKDRKQLVKVNKVEGGNFLINIGVPQGSVLGPTLFKIYIMDMHCYTELFCVKFADDSSFEGAESTKDALEEKLNMEMVKVNKWFSNNRLTLHPDKSRYLIHSKDKLVNIKLGNKNITRCGYGLQEESVNLLGLQIDENLDWKVHIRKVEKKISKGNYLLWRHGKKMSIALKKIIYECFIRCHILYCLPVWGGATQISLKPLNKLLHKSWAKIGKRKSHTLNRLQKYELLKLEDELSIQESKILWRWEKDKLPKSLNSLIKEKQDRLRGRRFEQIRNMKIGSIHSRLTKRANSLMPSISNNKSKMVLAKEMKKRIFSEKYSFNCTNRNCFICA